MIDTSQLLLFGIPAVVVVGATVEAIKILLKDFGKEIPKERLPLLSIGIAILLFVLSGGYTPQGLLQNIIYGIFVGLMASGGYDVLTKSILKKEKVG